MEFIRILELYFIFSLSTTVTLALPNEQELDRISALPGQPSVEFSQFSGYVTVNETHGRALFYWLTEATTNATTKPLVLWLNGGPGCSSVAYGASEEIGPFKINKNASSLYLNEYSWNKVANILFIESPAGVGFSYTNTSSDLDNFGDEQTASDALIFLIKWIQRFPQYKHSDFYLSGESYAGHYVPQLANKIYDYNKNLSQPFINLKGFIVGNAVTDNYYDNVGTITYWWTHSIISDHTYDRFMKDCDYKAESISPKCEAVYDYAYKNEFGTINSYSIYAPNCKELQGRKPKHYLRGGYDPCNNYAEKYYNKPDVQKALHANTTGIPYNWTYCSRTISDNWTDYAASVLPIYTKLIGAGLRIWVYSGDTDAVVPTTATRFSLRNLNLTIKTPWYPWSEGGEVGGWTEVYNGLTFATVRGAGHEVPVFQPERAFKLFQTFLSGKDLPKS